MSPLPRLPSFRERAPWWGGDLQTIGTAFRGLPAANGNRSSSEPMSFPLPDGDTLLATLDRPATRDESRPLAVVIHGCPGAEDSPSVLWAAHLLLAKGYCVLRPNLRGAGRSRTTCGGQYYAGSSRDVGALLAQLPADLTQAGVIAIGHSLGGAILLKYLGESGTQSGLRAAATVSAPLDLLGTCRSLMEPVHWPYHRFVLGKMKQEATAPGAQLSDLERRAIDTARTLFQYDDLFTAPRNGYAGADDYYHRCSALAFVGGIRTPTLVVASLDDPWVPGRAYSGHYWPASPSVTAVLSARGGHVGFHDVASLQPWSDRVVGAFLDATLAS